MVRKQLGNIREWKGVIMEELKDSMRPEETETNALEQEVAEAANLQTEDPELIPDEIAEADAYELDLDELDDVNGGAVIREGGTKAGGSTKGADIASQTQDMLTSRQLFALRRGEPGQNGI